MESEPINQISNLVSGRLPEFVRVDHPTLVAFLEAYYEWLQIKDRAGKIMSPMALQDVIDIDGSMDEFISHFKKEYLIGFPEQLAVSKATGEPVDARKLMKNIKSFYRAKGTEKSYEFLFRILYDTAVEFYYPKKDILRISDAKWYEKVSIKVTNSLGNRIFDSVGQIVYQRNIDGKITSSAKVIDVTLYQQGQYDVAELVLAGRNGSFTPNTWGINFDTGTESLHETAVYSVVGSVTVNEGGSGYVVGDRVHFTPAVGDSGEAAIGTVSLVTSTGSIRKIRMDNFGINYDLAPSVSVDSLNGTGFSGTAVLSAVCVSEGKYINTDGLLSSRKVLQDNHYYQDFSYVLKSEVVVDEYRENIRRLVHPAGTAMFGQVLIKRCSKENLMNSSALIRYEVPYIGNYMPYTFNTFDNLRDWFSLSITGSIGYSPAFHDPLIRQLNSAPPGIPDIRTFRGNPISLNIPARETTAALPPLGLSGFHGGNYNADPFFIVYEHPNRKVTGPVIAQVWANQADDFALWNEWCSVTGGDISGSGKVSFLEDLYAGNVDKKYAFLNYTNFSSFRKMTVRSILEMPISEPFDCRTEKVEVYANPKINILFPGNGADIPKITLRNPLTISFRILNDGPKNLSKVNAAAILVSVGPNWSQTYELDTRSTSIKTLPLQGGVNQIRVDLIKMNGDPIGIFDKILINYVP